MDVVVKGRNVVVPDHFREHVEEKLSRSERYDSKIIRVDVELSHEKNRRQAKTRQRVQITLGSKGPVVRAEAAAETFYTALDDAVHKLEAQLRRAADRRRRREHTPAVAAAATADDLLPTTEVEAEDEHENDGPGRIVRTKSHPATPISVDDALYQMELVGHDFYLFTDAETSLPSVVYRRKGFDYGLLRLDGESAPSGDQELEAPAQ